MFLLREPLWLILISGAVGYFCGWGKGRSGLGLLLGLLLGPLGCLVILLIPPAQRRSPGAARGENRAGNRAETGPACSRCGRTVPHRARACSHCGNVLIPIRYAVEGERRG